MENTKYVGKEYKTIKVNKQYENLCKDSMEAVGWIYDQSTPSIIKKGYGAIRLMTAPLSIFGGAFKEIQEDHESLKDVEVTFSREREQTNKTTKNELGSKIETLLHKIEHEESSKVVSANAAAYGIGLAGTVFMALATFSYLGGMLVPCIGLAAVGFIGWILAYVAFVMIKGKKTEKADHAIEEMELEINNICTEAMKLQEA